MKGQEIDAGVATEGHPYKHASGSVIVGAALRGRPPSENFS
jgi:hypothetical protein